MRMRRSWALGLSVWVALGCSGAAGQGPESSTGAGASGSKDSGATKTVIVGEKKRGTAAPAVPGKNVPAVKVNTAGYPSKWPKIAVFNVEPKNAVVKDASGKVALKIDVADKRGLDPASQDQVWQVDFSALTKPGKYTLEGGGAKSDPFEIRDDVYGEALVAGLKHFYFQRTRTALIKPHAVWEGDEYLRKTASHVHDDVGWDVLHHPEKKQRWKLEGGWHDAGNYDMYVPSTGPTAQGLLMAYEWDPSAFKDNQLNIPESGNRIPDILDEAKWGLIWVLSMQEPKGAFRHRESVMKWSPEGPADQDKTVRWVTKISSAATHKGVAAAAICARIYPKFDAALANRCRAAAKKGWAWLQQNPKRVRDEKYGSDQPLWDDEPGFSDVGARMVSAAEMWRSFKDQKALQAFEKLLDEKETKSPDLIKGAWANLSRWGLGQMALETATPKPLRQKAKQRLLEAASSLREQVEEKDGYRCASGLDDYYWGHNSNLLEKAHILLMAHRLAPEQGWMLEAARDQWHWILGRNPNGYSMVTRIGKGPDRIYHMEWGDHEPPPPGYLIGGPNGTSMAFLAPGAPAKALLWDNPKALRSGLPPGSLWHWRQSDLWDGGFVEEGKWTDGWWAVTEPDIYYNANLVLVGVAMQK